MKWYTLNFRKPIMTRDLVNPKKSIKVLCLKNWNASFLQIKDRL